MIRNLRTAFLPLLTGLDLKTNRFPAGVTRSVTYLCEGDQMRAHRPGFAARGAGVRRVAWRRGGAPVAARLVTVRGAGPTPSPTPSTALSRVLTTREI